MVGDGGWGKVKVGILSYIDIHVQPEAKRKVRVRGNIYANMAHTET
jgi:hypothetical protein